MTTGNRRLIISALLSALEILLIFSATYLLGRAVDEISRGQSALPATLPIVAAYGICVYFSTVFNIALNFYSSFERNQSIGRSWKSILPLQVSAAQRLRWERFFASIWDQIPRSLEIELNLAALYAQVIVVYAAIAYRAFTSGRYELLIASVPLVILNLLANKVGAKAWQMSIESNQREKAAFLGWHQRYFANSSNLFRAWRLKDNPKFQRDWLDNQARPVENGLARTWRVQLGRIAAKSILCDLPFYAGICFFLYLGIIGKISVGSIFFWLTMNELLFRANSNIRQILDRRTELSGLQKLVNEELEVFRNSMPPTNAQKAFGQNQTFPITLQNGEVIELHCQNGLQIVKASNGSGKTHLLKALAGEDLPLSGAALEFKSKIAGRTAMLIEPDFESLGLNSALEELLGPKAQLGLDGWANSLNFSESLKNKWKASIQTLLHKYPATQDLTRASRGEKSLFSFVRGLTCINQADVVLVDEIDGPLNGDLRDLVQQTLVELGHRAIVIMVSHHQPSPIRSYSERGVLLGYDGRTDLGHSVPFVLRMNDDNDQERTALGNIAPSLMPLLSLGLEILSSFDPNYKALKKKSFTLQCNLPGAKLRGIDSAGLAIVLALINLKRKLEGKTPFADVAATGHVDLGGEVHAVAGLVRKREAAEKAHIKIIVSPEEVHHVQELEGYLISTTSAV